MLRFLLPLLVALIAGCALPVKQPVTEQSHQQWQQRQQQLATFQQWSIRGRIALFVNDDVYNLGLGWIRDRGYHTLNLEASLGQGMIRLVKRPGQAEMTTPEGDTHYSDNAQQLLEQTTQLSIPVEGLETWITGLPHQNSDHLPVINAAGRALTLTQDGWKINYLEYEKVTIDAKQTLDLPHKLYLKHQDLALKIVVDQWLAETSQTVSPLFPDFPN